MLGFAENEVREDRRPPAPRISRGLVSGVQGGSVKSDQKLQLVFKSRKVVARVESFDDSFMTWDGQVRSRRRRVKVYDYILDERQTRMLEEAARMANSEGLPLEETDVSRRGMLHRILWSVLSRGDTTTLGLAGAQAHIGARPSLFAERARR